MAMLIALKPKQKYQLPLVNLLLQADPLVQITTETRQDFLKRYMQDQLAIDSDATVACSPATDRPSERSWNK
jgi:hypothetical protein